jgi:hypothetical protein
VKKDLLIADWLVVCEAKMTLAPVAVTWVARALNLANISIVAEKRATTVVGNVLTSHVAVCTTK